MFKTIAQPCDHQEVRLAPVCELGRQRCCLENGLQTCVQSSHKMCTQTKSERLVSRRGQPHLVDHSFEQRWEIHENSFLEFCPLHQWIQQGKGSTEMAYLDCWDSPSNLFVVLLEEDGPPSLPFPAFLGGRGGASVVGDVGESVLVETKIWLVKAP